MPNKPLTKEAILDSLSSVRKFIQNDGGDLEVVELKQDSVTISLIGACQTCHMNFYTFESGIKSTILQHFPHIKEVKLEISQNEQKNA